MNDEDRKLAEQAKATKEVNENWPMHQASIELFARFTHARYAALMARGFTESQALYLVKA